MKKMNYESVLIMDPETSKEDQKLFFRKIKQITEQFDGEFYHIDTWGLRKLANKNKKKWSQGLYFHFSFEAKKGVIQELTRVIRINDKVLYFHFEAIKISLEEHLKNFRSLMEEVVKKEKDRLLRIQKKTAFYSKKVEGH